MTSLSNQGLLGRSSPIEMSSSDELEDCEYDDSSNEDEEEGGEGGGPPIAMLHQGVLFS